MGLETARALAQKGFLTVMLCRNAERGETARASVNESAGRETAELLLCDLADLQDVRRCAAEFSERFSRLDVLVNNAGVMNVQRQETKDGLEAGFGVCHIGHFLLTNLLLPRMGASARIVVVSSVAHKVGKIDFNDLEMKNGYNVAKSYSRSKLCNVLFVAELARRLAGTGVTVNAVHPGAVATNIGAAKRRTSVGAVRKFFGRLLSFFVKTPAQGAATAIYVATSDECDGVSGRYFANCAPAKPSLKMANEALAKQLWQVSAEITGFFG